MDNRIRWITALSAILFAVAVGIVSYNFGVAHGQSISEAASGQPPMAARYWYRPFGFGFFGPFFFLFFGFFALRLLFWGGLHRRRWFDDGPYGGSQRFEEWHRRAHEQMNQPPRV